ncbi:GDP-D-glucose phosphorylase 1-like isoform X2 [Macrosteles quadrilineatus]|nr:GDP-D-glucose phosphorylase 1-like isoform X2 [Macrosteles quadrilineatus]XP_054256844.1 GDP-D-glucose phosphorylase 1-like isoform X2 [Macrosteles quadrilineatus]XP_054256846.1 GDP-D-glucose phosphorylase 1-like isoform X2 [Macrosteles quadrilineatus]XP_054256847.1 GDP-D-glucose phosphorylase 1-like isoform X2 [Macrosteles quadrilineatus]XP_054256848.1 GDP-D-glucose phosphorylase 1-like isoform X2 [Macrosteles quadrilineatus]XP_054256849.1 GDP-D-glucose phosphorylase 1-like isoform X2 [Mac
MPSLFEYSEDNFIFETCWSDFSHVNSTFDKALITKWSALQDENKYFKYKLHIDDSKILPGKFKYLAQLNVARGTQRRKPINVQSMKQMFDPTVFNFTKMDEGEILFQVWNIHRKDKNNYLAINVSPIGFGHSLLVPSLYDCLPQVMTENSLLTAIELFLLSKSPALRMGFNGLCANASVNHLHYHLYYLEEKMMLETINVEHLAGPCHMLLSFPSKGFAFQLSKGQNIPIFVRDVYKLVNLLQESEIPHNVTVTRGSGFQEQNPGESRNHVRVYVWARKPTGPDRDIFKFVGPALCELFGHLMIKTQEKFDSVTEDYVNDVLTDQTEETFQSVLEKVKHLYEE